MDEIKSVGPPHALPPVVSVHIDLRYHPGYERWCAYAVWYERDIAYRPAAQWSCHLFADTREQCLDDAVNTLITDRQYELMF